ncbi:hypothetical protein SAMN02745163_00995 [Clostridium cavendishii DSM 21758]|uniref:Peptidase M16C associated domain-containing protein n=1 Tax=Clostridium cavendishii DSM 21758 TaxID=1121302 RepID=A0A1M6EZT5_9CLOT|nr:insulinase family protein [Clostridium cavendishii]SHI90889.1 hypothetical protein SAMN02745163_00995 [Clostridium cavendishii DSM 21758]
MNVKFIKRMAIVISIFILSNIIFGVNSLKAIASHNINLRVGDNYSGFKLVKSKESDELKSKLHLFTHEKTGATLVYIENKDENKCFDINFYTPPTDNTGVNHILEHSLLYGSKKYNVKSPLMEIVKRGIVNDANAITKSDRTEFLFSTNNYKDFKNNLDIYMDAVFNPNFTREKNIFYQQGGHYELNSEEDKLSFNGVVYNEMKAHNSNTDVILMDHINNILFKNTPYAFESGGKVSDIPNLTYEMAKETYYKNYHPSNSLIYVYGNLDILDTLKFLDNNYLGKYEKRNYTRDVARVNGIENKEAIFDYGITKGSNVKDKTFLVKATKTYVGEDVKDLLGLQILNYILLGTDNSPIKKIYAKNNIGTAIEGFLSTDTPIPVYIELLRDGNIEDKDKYLKVRDDELKRLIIEGIPKDTIEGAINTVELELKKEKISGSRGSNYNEIIMQGFLFYNDPFKLLENDKYFDEIKSLKDKGYFEKLINKYLLNKDESALIILKPNENLNYNEDLSSVKLSQDKRKNIIEETKAFKEYQKQVDSDEELKCIQNLELKDIDYKIKPLPLKEEKVAETKVLYHPLYTDKIVDINYYFDTTTVNEDNLLYIELLANLLGRLDTKNYSLDDLIKTSLKLGSIKFSNMNIPKFKDGASYYPKLRVDLTCLESNSINLNSLAKEIIENTNFKDKEKLRVYIKELRVNKEISINNSRESLGVSSVKAYLTEASRYNELFNLDYYKFLIDLDKNFDVRYENLTKSLEKVKNDIFNKRNLTIGMTCEEKSYKDNKKSVEIFLENFRDEKAKKYTYELKQSEKNIGFIVKGEGQYVAKGANLKDLGYTYKGSLDVLAQIITNEYLMPEIREKGGAYGSSLNIDNYGDLIFSSWRDPKLMETLSVYNKTGDFLSNNKNTSVKKYILGLIINRDNLLDSISYGALSDYYYFQGVDNKVLNKRQEEILNTTNEEVLKFKRLLDKLAKEEVYSVVGGEKKIEEHKDMFNKVIKLSKN